MKVNRLTEEKIVTTKYTMSTSGIYPGDYLHNQRDVAQRNFEYYKRKSPEGMYDSLIYYVKPYSARDEIEAMTTPDNKGLIGKELFSKYRSTVNRTLKDYSYEPHQGIYVLGRVISSHDNQENGIEQDAIRFGIKEYVKKYGEEEASLAACDELEFRPGYDEISESYRLANPDHFKVIERKQISADEAGQEKFSAVHNGSFTTFYYHRVKVIAFGEEFEGIMTRSHYYSGGWN